MSKGGQIAAHLDSGDRPSSRHLLRGHGVGAQRVPVGGRGNILPGQGRRHLQSGVVEGRGYRNGYGLYIERAMEGLGASSLRIQAGQPRTWRTETNRGR